MGNSNLRQHQFKEVFYKFYPSLYNYAYSILGNKELSEDIVQDSFLKVWEKKRDLVGIDNIRFYLFSVVRNRSLTSLKNQQKHQIVELTSNSQIEDNLESEKVGFDVEKLVHEALKRLPPKCREIFLLTRISNLSYKEVADMLNISIKTVENQMVKALKIIRIFVSEKNMYLILIYFFTNNSGKYFF